MLPDGKGPTCAAFLARAAGSFAEHGIEHIERVMTDNAWIEHYNTRRRHSALGGLPPVSRLSPT